MKDKKNNPVVDFYKNLERKYDDWKKQRHAKKEEKRMNSAFEKEVELVDLNSLSRPYNNPHKTGNIKIRDFSAWAKWKNLLVGLIAVVAFFLLWWLITAVNPGLVSLISSPSEVWQRFKEMAIDSNIVTTASSGCLKEGTAAYDQAWKLLMEEEKDG